MPAVETGRVPYPNFEGKHEHAALFAVGAYRGVDVAAAFVISDLLANERWHAQFHDAVATLHDVYGATLDALA